VLRQGVALLIVFFAHFRGSTGCPGGVGGATMTTRGPSKGKEDC
jgi:hypothetical protein